MKHILFFLSLFSIPFSAFAASFLVEKSHYSNRRATELRDIVLDVANTCASNCKYKMSGIKEMKLLETPDKNHQYIWFHVEDIRDTKQYQEVEITELGEGHFSVISRFPPKEKIQDLEKKYTHPHETFFDVMESHWVLQEEKDPQKGFLRTKVDYSTKAETSSFTIILFSGTVRKKMEATALEMMENLK